MTARTISVVLPVYNEADNIATCLRRLAAALAGVEHEILVCYDFDADTTLPAIAAMPDRPASVRLVRNDLGKGAANALRAGFRAARGDVVVTTMADLSDPPERIPALAEHLRAGGYAVVAGSRYMRGGSQSGGPFLKRTFSRTAGLLLHWIAGLGTHDATNNFRAYSRRFLDSVGIESERGFEIALELTVKAQAMGLRVGEIPSSWTDRSAGASRFRMWAWMPSYLRWWLRAAREPLLVWAAWLAMLGIAIWYVGSYAARVPFWDDLEVLRLWLPTGERNLQALWALHNEHRIPLPRLIQVGLLHLTGDFRSGMMAQVGLYALLSAAMILVARAVRGRTSWTDAFFPLVWLHIGNCENLLMGFQISLALPTALVCVFLLIAVARPRGPSVLLAFVAVLALVGLPLCGGPGLTQAPPLVAGALLLGGLLVRGRIAGSRAAGWTLVLGALATIAIVALYFVGFRYAAGEARTTDPSAILPVSTRFLALGLGQSGQAAWPWSAVLVLLVVLVAVLLCLDRLRRVRAERLRAGGLLVAAGATLALALGIGHGRGGADDPIVGFAVRYVGLPAPLLCTAYFAAQLYGGLFTSALVRGTLVLALLAGIPLREVPAALHYGERRLQNERELSEAILSGESSYEVYSRFSDKTYIGAGGFFYLFGLMAEHRVVPFDQAGQDVIDSWSIHVFRSPPSRVETVGGASVIRPVGDGFEALVVPPQSGVHLPLLPESRRLDGMYGAMPAAYTHMQAEPVEVLVVMSDGVTRTVLFQRVLDPVRRPEDRGPQGLHVALPDGHAGGEIILRTRPTGPDVRRTAWAYWADVALY